MCIRIESHTKERERDSVRAGGRTLAYETAGEITETLNNSRKGKQQKRIVAILNTKNTINILLTVHIYCLYVYTYVCYRHVGIV